MPPREYSSNDIREVYEALGKTTECTTILFNSFFSCMHDRGIVTRQKLVLEEKADLSSPLKTSIKLAFNKTSQCEGACVEEGLPVFEYLPIKLFHFYFYFINMMKDRVRSSHCFKNQASQLSRAYLLSSHGLM